MQNQETVPTTIDEYIRQFPEDIRTRLEAIRTTVREAAPDAEEVISYKMPTFRQDGVLVHFAAYQNHIGLYPAPSGIEAFKEELAPYFGGKGSARFPADQPLPLDLIRKMVEYRLRENQLKASQKAGKKK
ncbi:iron chaperone [Larkinella soli]|uniref:iron chaperone n=1 Tax=Larkinella soli TaxID=1770527 RepID=UPI000FFC9594|nr:DUF1801 domain-containing protein [Larkinella soli]